MVSDVIEELLQIANAQGCVFPSDFKEKTIQAMLKPTDTNSIMYQDFSARRPMEVETYLGSPIKLAEAAGTRVPRIETLYALLHNCNILNQSRPPPSVSPNSMGGHPNQPRLSSGPPPRPMMNGGMNGMPNGMVNGPRRPSTGPPMRRGPPPMNGYPPRASNGYPRGPPPNQLSRRTSFENNEFEEFSHVVQYDDIPEGDVAPGYPSVPNGTPVGQLSARERDLIMRERDLQMREQEYGMRRGGGRRAPPSHRGGFDDDDDEDDYFDPMAPGGPPIPQIDPDNFDMMSVTSRRNRKAPSAGQLRKNPEMQAAGGGHGSRTHSYQGPRPGLRNRGSSRLMSDVPGLHDPLMENAMMGYSSNRYGNVDRKAISDESRANSLTRERLSELQGAGNNPGMNGAYPSPRRASLSPGDPFNAARRPPQRHSPPRDGFLTANGMPTNGMPANGRPSPPGMMRQPVPRHPPGQGNAVAPQQVEQHAGVSNQHPPTKRPPFPNVRSLTGSASASAGSGSSGASALLDSENSAHSSQSSLGARRVPVGVK